MTISKKAWLPATAAAVCVTVGLLAFWRLHSSLPRGADPRAVLTIATYIRGLGSEAPFLIQRQLQSMPVAVFQRDAGSQPHALLAWSLLFKGSMIRLEGLKTPTPQIAYYNPIADVLVMTGCRYSAADTKPQCLHMCAMPGEVLNKEGIARAPAWLTARDPLEAMLKTTAKRISTLDSMFGGVFPPSGIQCGAENQAASELRLVDVSAGVANVDVSRFSKAVAAYLARVDARMRSRNATDKKAISTDRTLRVLSHLDQLSLSGAVSAGEQARILFFTPKRTGWGQVAMVFSLSKAKDWTLNNVRFLTMTSKGD
jgi:hypothetical protein